MDGLKHLEPLFLWNSGSQCSIVYTLHRAGEAKPVQDFLHGWQVTCCQVNRQYPTSGIGARDSCVRECHAALRQHGVIVDMNGVVHRSFNPFCPQSADSAKNPERTIHNESCAQGKIY